MATLWYIAGSILLSILIINIIWRLLSRYITIPCPVWLGWLVELDNPFTKVNRADTIIEQLSLKLGMKVVDVGCGPGRLTIPLAKAVGPDGEVVAMDIQKGMLEQVQAKAEKACLNNIRFINKGVGNGALETDYYDCIVLVTVLGEIVHRNAALKELFSALKPGGILSITEVIFDPHFQRRAVVSELATAVGFQKHACMGKSFAYTMHFKKPDNYLFASSMKQDDHQPYQQPAYRHKQ